MKNEKSESSVIRTVFRKDGYSGVVTAFFPDEPSIMGRGISCVQIVHITASTQG